MNILEVLGLLSLIRAIRNTHITITSTFIVCMIALLIIGPFVVFMFLGFAINMIAFNLWETVPIYWTNPLGQALLFGCYIAEIIIVCLIAHLRKKHPSAP